MPILQGSRSLRILLRLAMVLLSLLLAIVAVEVAVWGFDPYGISTFLDSGKYRSQLMKLDVTSPRLFRQRPDSLVECRHYDIRTDSRGLRGPEREQPKPEGVRRILFLGDSVTLGWGVAEEDTFVALLEQRLNQRGDARWETINAGHLFHDSTQELGLLEEIGFDYEPDIVLLIFVDNDYVLTRKLYEVKLQSPEDNPKVSEEAKQVMADVRRLAKIEPYLPYTHALLTFLYIHSHPAGQQGSAAHAEKVGLDLVEGWQEVHNALRRMKELCAEHGVAFAVINHNSGSQLVKICEEEAIPLGSMSFTEEQKDEGIRLSQADAHANPKGHRYLVEHLQRSLEELQLVPATD